MNSPSTLGPIDHIARAHPPWRDPSLGLSECGLPVANHPVVSLDEAVRRFRTLGRQRAAFTLCMTCVETAQRRSWVGRGGERHEALTWDSDPAAVIEREAQNATGYRWGSGDRPLDRLGALFRRELRAMAALVAAHPEEFEGYVAGLDETVDLASARDERAKRKAGR